MRELTIGLFALLLAGFISAPDAEGAAYIKFDARLEVEVLPLGGTFVHLLAGGPFGPGGIGGGAFDPDSGGVVRPEPFIWLALDAAGAPATDDIRTVSFGFDPGGDFMGVQPQPFRIFHQNNVNGELDFSNVSGVTMGSLNNITGLQLITATGTISIDPFSIQDIPEPSALLLLGTGLIGLVASARRRRHPDL